MSTSATLPPPVPVARTNPLAVVALISGIFSFMGGIMILLIPTVVAIVCGHVAQTQCRKDPNLKGEGMAIAGYALGYASFFSIIVVGLLAAMAIPAFQSVRHAAMEGAVEANLQQLYYAAQRYSLENDVEVMQYDDLVGPGKLVEQINVIHGEEYPTVIRAEEPLTVTLENGVTVTFPAE